MKLSDLFRRKFQLSPAQRQRVQRLPVERWKRQHGRPPFFLVGPARSGTGYIAALLTSLDVPTGHEAMFGAYGFKARLELCGDSSWLAVPFLDDIPSACPVLFQARNPIRIVQSNFEIGFLQRGSKFDQFAAAVLGAKLPAGASPLESSILYVLAWMDAIRRRQDRLAYTYRLEAIGVETVLEICAQVGVSMDAGRVERALASLPRNVNDKAHKKTGRTLDWNAASPELRRRLQDLAVALGYDGALDVGRPGQNAASAS